MIFRKLKVATDNPLVGIYYILIASFSFALTMFFAKLLSKTIGAVEITFFRNIIGLVIILFILKNSNQKQVGGKISLLFFRGIIGTIALLFFFYTVSITSLSNAITYSKTEPIFTALLTFIFLKERSSHFTLLASIVGFSGIWILNSTGLTQAGIFGIITGFLSALAYTSVRTLKIYYTKEVVVLSFMFFGTIVPLLLMTSSYFISKPTWLGFMISSFITPQSVEWIYILGLGISAAIGQIFMTKAYFATEASIVSTASYSVILFATILGLLSGDPIPTLHELVGISLIFFSGLLLLKNKKNSK